MPAAEEMLQSLQRSGISHRGWFEHGRLRVFVSNMGRLGVNLLFIVVIATATMVLRTTGQTRSSAVGGSSHSSRGCVYSFQVWTPNQDVLAKLRRLEERCDAVRSSVEHEARLTKSLSLLLAQLFGHRH